MLLFTNDLRRQQTAKRAFEKVSLLKSLHFQTCRNLPRKLGYGAMQKRKPRADTGHLRHAGDLGQVAVRQRDFHVNVKEPVQMIGRRRVGIVARGNIEKRIPSDLFEKTRFENLRQGIRSQELKGAEP